MELDKLKSPCDKCERNHINKTEYKNMKICETYRAWYKEVSNTLFETFFGYKRYNEEEEIVKKCVDCKHGVFVELWGEWKCRKHEKTCYNEDSYYDNCKDYVRKDQKEEEND